MKRKDETQTQFTLRVMRNHALQEAVTSFTAAYKTGSMVPLAEVVSHLEKMQDWRE